jgi:hypothetical protein
MKKGDLVKYKTEYDNNKNEIFIVINDDYKIISYLRGVKYSKSFNKKKIFLLFYNGEVTTEYSECLEII